MSIKVNDVVVAGNYRGEQIDWNASSGMASILNKPTNLVHTTGNETISGEKTFTNRYVNITTTSDATGAGLRIIKNDDHTKNTSVLDYTTSNGSHYTRLMNTAYNKNGYIDIIIGSGGTREVNMRQVDKAYVVQPTTDSTDSYEIDTVGARNTKLANYSLDNSVVHLSGDETVAGNKTFVNNMFLKDTNSTIGTTTSAWQGNMIQFQDSAGTRVARLQPYYVDADTLQMGMYASNGTTTESGIWVRSNGVTYAPKPGASNSTTWNNIATVGWVNDATVSTNVVHRTTAETINGMKTFGDSAPKFRNDVVPSLSCTANKEDALISTTTNTSNVIDGMNVVRSVIYNAEGDNERKVCYRAGFRKSDDSGNLWPAVSLGVDTNGITYGKFETGWSAAPTPSASNSTTATYIATTGWVNDATKSTNVVHRSGDETIAGTKTFSNPPYLSIDSTNSRYKCKDLGYAQGDTPTANRFSGIDILDKNGVEMGTFFTTFQTDGSVRSLMWVKSPVAGSTSTSAITIGINSSGTAWTAAPTPPAGNNSTQIATTAWCYDPTKSTNLVHRTGDETIGGTKTFSNTIQGTAYRALYADLAEYYEMDMKYPTGTLVQFGGDKEMTIASTEVNAVISESPAFIMNGKETETSQPIALIGKVKIRVEGKVNKFDRMVLSENPGIAIASNDKTKKSIGKALENKEYDEEGLVLCSVKIDWE